MNSYNLWHAPATGMHYTMEYPIGIYTTPHGKKYGTSF